jgi:aspartyl/glutamyl-tRNA(Asn/Gln) amidotransferase C subunit
MATITDKEIRKLASLSHIALTDQEIGPLTKQVDEILAYAQRVIDAAQDVELTPRSTVNVFRKDFAKQTDVAPILAQAPAREQDYFVVPVILKKDS